MGKPGLRAASAVGLPGLGDLLKLAAGGIASTGREGLQLVREWRAERPNRVVAQREMNAVQKLVDAETRRRQKNELMGLPPTYCSETDAELGAVKAMPYYGLVGTDMKTSLLGMGLSAAAGSYGRVERKVAIEAVQEAYRLGINFFDTAPLYGFDRAGENIVKEALAGVPRESYYLTTKVGRYLDKIPDKILGGHRWRSSTDYRFKTTLESVERSLTECGVDYFDAVFVHDPNYADEYRIIKRGALMALADLVDQGAVRYSGVASYDLTAINMLTRQERKEEQQDVKRDRAVNLIQVAARYNLLNTTLTKTRAHPYRFLEHMMNSDIGVISAAPMAMGLFTPQGPPRWHNASKEMLAAAKDIREYCAQQGVDLPRICMMFAFKQTAITPHLVGMATPEEVRGAVAVAQNQTMSKAEAHCLNWALHRLEALQTDIWTERDAVWNGSGWLSDKAKHARHYDDSQASQWKFVRTGGMANSRWTDPRYLYGDTPVTTGNDFIQSNTDNG
eukprot:TRINITY_DN19713_c0_g1_i1.p1 TRINITY_DN19713_c0_g1~~TRINITY_DN19713_c0_g1_i1.p1  ORF type:complete len:505 (+),score=171.01 TRINITY_DN19713_c0_g1_i1:88-1602(+)